ncbi:MAG: hypothetical protein WBA39_18340 [Rivularia sp. (in: cyanobacteria)]
MPTISTIEILAYYSWELTDIAAFAMTVIGSTTAQLLRSSDIPILLFR